MKKKFIVKDSLKIRIDLYLRVRFPKASRSKLIIFIKRGFITVNNKKVKPSFQVQRNQTVSVDVPFGKVYILRVQKKK